MKTDRPYDVYPQDIKLGTNKPYDVLVKGSAYVPQFLAGAGGLSFTLDNYTLSSWDWVLQMEWTTLQIRPIN